MISHKEQEKTGEYQHDLSYPLLPFVAKQDRSLSLGAGFVVAPPGAITDWFVSVGALPRSEIVVHYTQRVQEGTF